MSEYWAIAPAVCVFLFIIGATIWKHGYWCGGRDEARRAVSDLRGAAPKGNEREAGAA